MPLRARVGARHRHRRRRSRRESSTRTAGCSTLERRSTPGADIAETEEVIVEVVAALAARHRGRRGRHRRRRLDRPRSRDRAVLAASGLAGRAAAVGARRAHPRCPSCSTTTPTGPPGPSTASGPVAAPEALACVTLGTGIGGGLVIDGERLSRRLRHRGRVRPHDRRRRTAGAARAATAAAGRCTARATPSPARPANWPRPMPSSAPAGCWSWPAGSVSAITGEIVAAAAREGDPAAIEICAGVGRWLGRGLANLAAVLDPDLFVIGGGVSELGRPADRAGPARVRGHAARARATGRPRRSLLARLGPHAGLVGVADLARREFAVARSG